MLTTGGLRDGPWRVRLARQLAVLSAVLTPLLFLPTIFATSAGHVRTVLAVASVVLMAGFVWLGRRSTPEFVRSVGVVVAFFTIGALGYATLGFLSGPGVAFVATVAFSGLLLGRRAMFATIVICALTVGVIGTLMVHGVLSPPTAADISPLVGRSWVRTSAITLILIGVVGAAVTLVVEHVETALREVETEGERRREAERQMVHAQSTQLISQLAASLAHDVNNQLTVISSWTDLVDFDSPETDRRRAREAIAESVNQAATLTTQLLMLGRRDAPVPKAVGFSEFLDTSAKMLESLGPSDIELDVAADDDAWCWIDRSQLRQVLLNLAVNARAAMPDGGRLSVQARRRRAAGGVGTSGTIPVGDWVVLSVEDTGTGMDEATASRAFEPFFTTKNVGEGTGLGLATVAVIVEHAAGHIVLDTAVGRGTRVELWFPTIRAELPVKAADQPARPSLDPLRILLVEDSPGVLAVARRALEDAGAVVRVAADGDEGLMHARAGSYDILCTDVVMPGASVVDLISAFRDRNPGGDVLLCSGYVGEALVRHGIEEGRFQLLAKPYTPATLIEAIRTLRPALELDSEP